MVVLNNALTCLQRISEVKPGGFLRLRVDGGGCSGFKYKFELSESLDSDDHIFERYLNFQVVNEVFAMLNCDAAGMERK